MVVEENNCGICKNVWRMLSCHKGHFYVNILHSHHVLFISGNK